MKKKKLYQAHYPVCFFNGIVALLWKAEARRDCDAKTFDQVNALNFSATHFIVILCISRSNLQNLAPVCIIRHFP